MFEIGIHRSPQKRNEKPARIVILGSGFAGVEVLKKIQKEFQNDEIDVAWWLWRSYYLANVPNISKKVEVMIDWTIHLLFRRDVAIVKRAPPDRSRETECRLCDDRVMT